MFVVTSDNYFKLDTRYDSTALQNVESSLRLSLYALSMASQKVISKTGFINCIYSLVFAHILHICP